MKFKIKVFYKKYKDNMVWSTFMRVAMNYYTVLLD